VDVSVPQLQQFYRDRKYSVVEVTQWHLDRIRRFNGIYRAVETVIESDALSEAARLDAQPLGERTGLLWGVPIVIKANTSVAKRVTTAGWEGYKAPGRELVAPRDAEIVARFRRAGAIVLGLTNMPDFGNSDTNRSSAFGRTGNAYDVRFSPGGSSGGTVTAVTGSMAVLGNGTDTGNSIRMPAATSGLVGVFPTRGLVSTAGIAPLDWLLDNTGPIARSVTDAALALTVMEGSDERDVRTREVPASAQRGPFVRYLDPNALSGKRFGVPAFIMRGKVGLPFHGIPARVPADHAERLITEAATPMHPATLAAFLQALDQLRAAGATVVLDDAILPDAFARTAARVATYPYVREGTERFLREFGPAAYRSPGEYLQRFGTPLLEPAIGAEQHFSRFGDVFVPQRTLGDDPEAEANYHGPRRRTLAAYLEPLEKLRLDGYVYPAIQMPPPDETMPQNGKLSDGPHSATSWVNMLGVPAVVVVGGHYPGGMPFGLEFSGRPWTDGDLLGYAYAWEQQTRFRRPPVMVQKGLLTQVP
jgi:amidase